MNKRQTKTNYVLSHLEKNGSITSWDAIQKYGATRLSAIIFNLRKRGYIIETKTELTKDRYGNTCQFANYILKGKE